ncbi:MAG: hypothetical protein JWN72_43 [Thermoleophilia bacterium]|nr:hypothetical protein [Thermoleophilia bacterium]
MAKDISVELGLEGGASTAVSVPEDQLTSFREALRGDGWTTVTNTDGAEFSVDASKVVFVRVAAQSRGIGFSA